MYDEWYSFDLAGRKATTNTPAPGHKRKESLLQQPNGTLQASSGPELLENVYEMIPDTSGPPKADVIRRSKSSSELHGWRGVASAIDQRWKRKPRRSRRWDALLVDSQAPIDLPDEQEASEDPYGDALLEASQQEYLLYHDQLRLTERHLEGLIEDTDETLKLLTELSDAFKAVETQTSSFRARCEHLLTEQTRLQTLANEVGNDLHYYAYLDNVTRRLNAPGAARLVDDPDFIDVLSHLDSCIAFMAKHPTYRDSESYLARYEALLTKALHLLEVGFTARLEKVSAEIGRQMAATQSESARHVLAYARFEEMLLDSRFLCQNVQKVARAIYDQAGVPVVAGGVARDIYANTANNLFQTYLAARERDLKLITQRETDDFKTDAKSSSLETASRNFVKQGFERAYNESNLFAKIFDVEPQWSTDDRSVFLVLKSLQPRSPVNPATLAPLAAHLQAALTGAELATVCAVVGWLAHEYLLPADYDDEDSTGEPMPPFARKCRELSARLLTEHLWPFADAAFEAELTRSISKMVIPNDALKIGPVVGGLSSSNAYPPVKTALRLLGMFDGCMPKERSQKNSQVVFKIVRETIQVLQRAEAKIRSSRLATDPDLFMVKNLLIIKNELVSLEIGDIRSQGGGDAGGVAMQHFAQIWDALSPQSWAGFLSSTIGGLLWSSASAVRPGSAAGAGSGAVAATTAVTARTLTVEDMSSQLDELLRQSIYGFTRRWGGLLVEARGDRTGGRNVARVETQLDEALAEAFSNQPEVVGKLREAIAISAKAQREVAEEKKGVRRY